MGRNNEKTAGRSGGSCSWALEHFYDFAGCELNSEDRRKLSHHEESCPSCGPEFQEWRRLQGVLQGGGINAAADFKSGVMARIKETRQEPASRHSVIWDMVQQHGWARGLAAAAVILIMLSGVAKLPAGESLIAHLTKQAYVAFDPKPAASPIQTTVTANQPSATNPGGAISPTKATAPGTTSANLAAKTRPVQTQTQPTADGSDATQVAEGPSTLRSGGFAVSNKPMVITTTTLKIGVGDLVQARSAALNIAGSYGAGLTSEQSAQDGNSSLLFLHFTIDPSTASAFVDHLSSLGEMISANKTDNDVTGNYNSTLNAYKDLLAQQAAADDSDQGQYTSQLNFLENELQNWNDASGKQVVMLWLIQ
jgi:hypothetical protein